MKMMWTVWMAAALASSPWSGLAAEKTVALPKDLPPYGELKPLVPKHLDKFKLANGLEVWLIPEIGFPKVAMALAVRGGYAADATDRPGLSDLLAATITEGTKSQNAKQLAEAMQSSGGDLQADANADAIVVSTTVLAEGFEKGIAVLADVGQNATFAMSEVKLAGSNRRSNLEGEEASPAFLARRALYKALFADHPYATIAPTPESLAATTDTELKREYARRFRPDQAVLVVAGDVEPSKAKSTIQNAFNSWTAPSSAPIGKTPVPMASHAGAVVYVPRPNSVQTSLYMGTLMPSRSAPDYYAAFLANAIYGGTFGSRLVSNIREDKGYTYTPGSRITTLETAGVLVTRADVRNEVTGPSFNEINYELNRLATTAPTEPEINQAKRYTIGSLALQSQSRDSVVLNLVRLWEDGLPPEELWNRSAKLEHVSATEIEAAGRKYFPASRMTIVAVGDEKVIKDALTPFGLEFKKFQ